MTTTTHIKWEWIIWRGKETSYAVSNTGLIRNWKTGRLLKLCDAGKGYLQFTLKQGKKQYTPKVHRLVAQYFVPNPKGLNEVHHIDHNKANNNASNLQWVTHKRNMEAAVEFGVMVSGPTPESVSMISRIQTCLESGLTWRRTARKLRKNEMYLRCLYNKWASYMVKEGWISKVISRVVKPKYTADFWRLHDHCIAEGYSVIETATYLGMTYTNLLQQRHRRKMGAFA